MLLETLKTLLSVYGPTGNETQVAEAVKKIVAGKVDHARIDVMGNLIIEKKGQEGGKKIMISAHQDECGMLVLDIEDDGSIRIFRNGGVDPRILPGSEVIVHTKRGQLYGVVGAKPPHLLSAEERKNAPMFDDP